MFVGGQVNLVEQDGYLLVVFPIDQRPVGNVAQADHAQGGRAKEDQRAGHQLVVAPQPDPVRVPAKTALQLRPLRGL